MEKPSISILTKQWNVLHENKNRHQLHRSMHMHLSYPQSVMSDAKTYKNMEIIGKIKSNCYSFLFFQMIRWIFHERKVSFMIFMEKRFNFHRKNQFPS